MSQHLAPAPRLVRLIVAVAALVAFAWILTGCSSSGEEASYSAPDAVEERGADAEAYAGEDMAAADGTQAATEDRALIVTGAMYMTVGDPIAAADEAAGLVESSGGRVDARSERAATEYDGGSAWLTLRIPAARLDAVVDGLRALGTVDEYSTASSDVTREVTDLEARISTLRASTARIEALLTEAERIADIITLEDELAGRQAELESLEARQRGLDDQVAMSTIDLTLTTEPVVVVDDAPRSFWDGLVSGWESLVGFLSGALVVTGVVLPWLAAAGVLVAIVLIAVRRSRSRRAAREPASRAGAEASPAPVPADGTEKPQDDATPTLRRD